MEAQGFKFPNDGIPLNRTTRRYGKAHDQRGVDVQCEGALRGVDTNVLLDLVTDDQRWADWSIAQLEAASLDGPLVINDVIYAELAVGCTAPDELDAVLAQMAFEQSYRDWDPYLYGYGTITRTVLLQQLIDMETGSVLPFNASGMDAALVHDPVLLEEFRSLPKKQRNRDETLFRFLRMYNERHPLLFPQ